MKTILAFLCIALSSCVTTGVPYFVAITSDTIEVQKIEAAGPNDAVGVGYNKVTKRAYISYANGEKTNLKVIGGGIGGNTFALILEGGTRVSVNLTTGKVTTTGPQFEPLPQK